MEDLKKSPSSDFAIQIKGLSKNFAHATASVLREINLEVRPGERIALTGANGAGKTTLLRILATLVAPTTGNIWIAGLPAQTHQRAIRAKIAWVPASDGGFWPSLTGRKNLELFGSLRGLSPDETSRKIDSWQDISTLKQSMFTTFSTCSTGMKQALSICRAFLHDPDVILLDEPMRGLDRHAAESFRGALGQILEGKTLVMATHDPEDAKRLCNRHVHLKEGSLVEGDDSSHS